MCLPIIAPTAPRSLEFARGAASLNLASGGPLVGPPPCAPFAVRPTSRVVQYPVAIDVGLLVDVVPELTGAAKSVSVPVPEIANWEIVVLPRLVP